MLAMSQIMPSIYYDKENRQYGSLVSEIVNMIVDALSADKILLKFRTITYDV